MRWSRGGYAAGAAAKTAELLVTPIDAHTYDDAHDAGGGGLQQRPSPLGSPRRVRRVIMQALHFYTRRLVLLTALVFFGFLFLIASRSPSTDSDDPRGWSPNRGRFAQPMAMRPGEQRAEPPQAPPVAGLGWLPYSQLGMQSQLQSWPLKCLILGIPSTRDIEVVERLRMHLRDVDLKALAAATCPKNITLATYWAQTQTRAAVPRRDSWERFYADISSCDLYHDDSLVDTLLHDMATLPIKHAAIMEGGTQGERGRLRTWPLAESACFKSNLSSRSQTTNKPFSSR